MSSSAELLDILDIIRNEESYRAKLEEIKKEQQQLRELKYIAETMQQADEFRNKAKAEKEKYDLLMKNANMKIKENETKAYEEIDKLKSDARALMDEAKDIKEKAVAYNNEQREFRQKNLDKERDLRMLEITLKGKLEKVENLEKLYNSKVAKLKEVINL